MTQPDNDRSVQQLVPADEHGSSGLSGVGQRPVPADTGDLRGRIEANWKAWYAARSREDYRRLDLEYAQLKTELEATKTPVGGNEKLTRRDEKD